MKSASDVHPDVHLDVQFKVVIVLRLSMKLWNAHNAKHQRFGSLDIVILPQ